LNLGEYYCVSFLGAATLIKARQPRIKPMIINLSMNIWLWWNESVSNPKKTAVPSKRVKSDFAESIVLFLVSYSMYCHCLPGKQAFSCRHRGGQFKSGAKF
jgi:hypothetical protein